MLRVGDLVEWIDDSTKVENQGVVIQALYDISLVLWDHGSLFWMPTNPKELTSIHDIRVGVIVRLGVD
jgi:hypothetical protein